MLGQEKRRHFEEHLKEQEKEREAVLERRRRAEQQKSNPQQDMLFIQKQFRNFTQEYDSKVAAVKKGEGQFNSIIKVYDDMKAYYLDINYVLTTYDRQYYREALDKINTTILDLKRKYQPKKKFKFSRRDEDFGVKEEARVEEIKQVKSKESNIPGVESKKGEVLELRGLAQGGSFKIVDCSQCKIDLLELTEILFLKNLKGCTVRAALTKSTVFVDNCENCHFQLNCHQLRIHNTYKTRFCIFVTSKAIIQDCKQVEFTPYSFEYEARKQHQVQEQRANRPNLWREIQDFNWLKENEKSPHYTLIEP